MIDGSVSSFTTLDLDQLMAEIHFYASNNQQTLIEALADVVRQPMQNPLQPEHILVQHQGMMRWISLQLANRNNIEANTRYLFPHELLNLVFSQLDVKNKSSKMIEDDHLVWILLEKLLEHKDDPSFEPIGEYLKDNNPLRIWQLAKQTAYLFNQYMCFRPEMILRWEKPPSPGPFLEGRGEMFRWQQALWNSIPRPIRSRHKPYRWQTVFKQVEQLCPENHTLPQRLSVFGISSLTPLHVEVLKTLKPFVEIHFFFLMPSPHFTSYQVSGERNGIMEEQQFFAELCQYGRDFIQLLQERKLLTRQHGSALSDKKLFVEPTENSLLAELKKDMLYRGMQVESNGRVSSRSIKQHPGMKRTIPHEDRSLQIHACHSRMREVEVLHDQLLLLLDQNPDLTPDDILVMTPEIDEYAPLVHAVLSATVKGKRSGEAVFPYSITDQRFGQSSQVISYLLRLLRMPASRFTVNEVLDLLECEAMRARFELVPTDIAQLRQWMKKANVRWGIDASFRNQLETPATHENTWQFGIDRILLGYAMPGEFTPNRSKRGVGDGETLFAGILPFDDIEGESALMFGRFLDFFEKLKTLVGRTELALCRERTLLQWAVFIEKLLEDFFDDREAWDAEWHFLQKFIENLRETAEICGVTLQVEVEILTKHLEAELERKLRGKGFLGYGTTFCSLQPMRSIPFKVIALLGMNDKAFPRVKPPLSYDLMAENRRLGDHRMKEEDGFLFLETLLCCQKFLYVSYLGFANRDNAMLPPSSFVRELTHYLKQIYGLPEDRFLTCHSLQAFAPRYFQAENDLFSYSQLNWNAARQLILSNASTDWREKRVVFDIQLPEIETSCLEIDLEELLSFFNAPAQYLLQRRMGSDLGGKEEFFEDCEPFAMDPLNKYAVQSRQLETILNNRNSNDLWRIIRAQGDLPLSNAGDRSWQIMEEESLKLAQPVREFLQAEPLEPFEYDFQLHGFHLKGTIENIFSRGLIRFRPASIKIKDRLRVWLEQLILRHCSAQRPSHALLVGKNADRNKLPELITSLKIDTPKRFLEDLLACYEAGLKRPFAFFPETAHEYMKAWIEGKTEMAREKARLKWYGRDAFPGEMARNPYFKRCFSQLELIDETEFERNTVKILNPVFSHQKEGTHQVDSTIPGEE